MRGRGRIWSNSSSRRRSSGKECGRGGSPIYSIVKKSEASRAYPLPAHPPLARSSVIAEERENARLEET